MTENEIYRRVKAIVAEKLSRDESEVTLDATFVEDLRADSLDVVELVMRFEEEFDVEIPDDDAEKITTVGEAVEYISSKLKAKVQAADQ